MRHLEATGGGEPSAAPPERLRVAVAAGVVVLVVAGAAALTLDLSHGAATGPAAAAAGTASAAPDPAQSAATTSSADADGEVAWVDRPAPTPPAAVPSTQLPPAPAYPPCAAGQLEASAAGPNAGAAGNEASLVALRNVSGLSCSLSGLPTSIAGVTANGTRQAVVPQHPTMFDDMYSWPADLQPGDTGGIGITFTVGCAAAQQPDGMSAHDTAVVLGLPGGGTITAPVDVMPTCGIGVTTFGRPAPTPDEAGSYQGIKAQLEAPDTVAAGGTLHYTVTLTNTTDHAIALDPCPVYEQAMFVLGQGVHAYLQLNCDTVHAIPASAGVTYAMQLQAPDMRAAEPAKLFWQIPGAAEAWAGGTVGLVDASPSGRGVGTISGRALDYGGPMTVDGKEALDGVPAPGIVVTVMDGDKPVASATTGPGGGFSFDLPAGRYTLDGCQPRTAAVAAGATVVADLTCPVP